MIRFATFPTAGFLWAAMIATCALAAPSGTLTGPFPATASDLAGQTSGLSPLSGHRHAFRQGSSREGTSTESDTTPAPVEVATDPALDVRNLLQYLVPAGSSQAVQRTAGERHIVTLAQDLMIVEQRGSSAVTKVPLQSLFSRAMPDSACSLSDISLEHFAGTGRWAIAGVVDAGTPSSSVMVAVSDTEDPAGVWQAYRYQLDPGGNLWADAPAVSLRGNSVMLQYRVAETSARACGGVTEVISEESDSYEFGLPGADRSQTKMLSPRAVAASAATTSMTITPSTGSSSSAVYQLTYTDFNGVSDLTTANLLINSTLNGSSACFVIYTPSNNQFGLVNDAGTGVSYLGNDISSTVQNSQCTVSRSSTYVLASSGNSLTLSIGISFTGSFSGPKGIYMYASGTVSGPAGWLLKGAWVVPTVNLPPTFASFSPAGGAGTQQYFQITASDDNGWADLAAVNLLVNATLNGANGCFVSYLPATRQIELLNDAGNSYSVATIGTASTLQNSQCALDVLASTAGTSGSTLTLTVALKFKYLTFAGVKYLFTYDVDSQGANSGWQNQGTWVVTNTDQVPSTPTVTPSSGAGTAASFTFTVNDADGFGDISTIQVLINNGLSGAGACYFVYTVATNQITLYDNAATSSTSGVINSGGTLQNSQCSLRLSGIFTSGSNTKFGLYNVPITFLPGFVGSKGVWMYATDTAGGVANWTTVGSWAIPPIVFSPFVLSLAPASGSGTSQIFSAQFQDVNGVARITSAAMLVNTGIDGRSACYVVYLPPTNQFALVNDAGNSYSYVVPGSLMTVQNSQCILNGYNSSANSSNQTLGVQYGITFISGSFSGAKNIYLYATDNQGNSGWNGSGIFTVP